MSVVPEVGPLDACGLPLRDRGLEVRAGLYEPIKRVVDVCVACALLVLLSPLLVIAAVAIKVTSRGPVLYRGTVIGRYGEPFTYYKLRTMRVDADDAVHRQFIEGYVTAHETTRSLYKLTEDPRVTAVGRILRKTSLDEVAQMINVIRGEMSIVGPRPPVPYEFRLYNDYHKQRLAVLPGITGLAQVRARSRVSFEEMVEMDLEYIRRRSTLHDLLIMLRTVWVVLSTKGAH
jgi:lipopolysaccharide/colanic/teichoic acid biosynthesis glycosyltransferase